MTDMADAEASLPDRARALFAEVADRHGLRREWDDAPVDVACRYPAQPGRRFELWMTLDDDKVLIGGDGWDADILPADRPDTWQTIEEVLDRLVSGRARVVLDSRFSPGPRLVARGAASERRLALGIHRHRMRHAAALPANDLAQRACGCGEACDRMELPAAAGRRRAARRMAR